MSQFPQIRLRRLRQSKGVRKMLAKPLPTYSRFIWPVFLVEGENRRVEIPSMPKQYRYSIDTLCEDLAPLAEKGLGGVMLFGVIEEDCCKNNSGTSAADPNGIVQRATRTLREKFPELVIFTDVCVCAYTHHGHCGVLTEKGTVDNDATLKVLADVAVSHAAAGATGVAPSSMMDGQIQAIRTGLAENGYDDTILMSYSTKFASSMYGPFRDAADSAPGAGDRKAYQQPYDCRSQAIRESMEDEKEGADILMVKPALYYLDIIAAIKERSDLPMAAYNVSGEYSMLWASANNNWGDLYAMARESIMALDRAGTDIILSYWANQYEELAAIEV